MISIDLIRQNPDMVRRALAARGEEKSLEDIILLDADRRYILTQTESSRAKRNKVSKDISRMKEKPPDLVAAMREEGDLIKALEEKVKAIEADLEYQLLQLPNLPLEDVPEGIDETSNVIIETWGNPVELPFTPLPHWELGEKLGIIDFQVGAKLAGSRFFTLLGGAAKLQRALISWMLDLHTREHGYKEVYLPYMGVLE